MNVAAAAASSVPLPDLLAGLTEDPVPALGVTGVAADSRRVRAGDLFAACSGQRQHGLAHLAEASRKGAAAVAWEPDGVVAEPEAAVPLIRVPGLGRKLGRIADRFYGQPSRAMTVIGVTGTDGKTSVTQFLAQALDQEDLRCGVVGTLGWGLADALQPASHTTPDAVGLQAALHELRRRRARWVAMEVSSHALDQGRVAGVAFDIAVLTNLSRDHLDYHGDEASYARAKQRLFQVPGLEYAVVNLDDAFGRQLAREARDHAVLGYGLSPRPDAEAPAVWGEHLRFQERGLRLQVQTPWGRGELAAGVLGRFNAANLLAVLGVLLALGVGLEDALERLRHVRTIPGRMEAFGGGASPLVVVDYAHTAAALAHALQAVRHHCGGRLWCVFGCGGERDPGKRPLMGAAAEHYADRLIITDDNPRGEAPEAVVRAILDGLQRPERAEVCHDRGEAIARAVARAQAGDAVLVAGKGHEQVQWIGDEGRAYSDREVVRDLVGTG